MATSPDITLELKGPRGPADLADFANAVSALRNSLKNVCRCATGSESLEYEVVDLRFASAVIEASPVNERFTLGIIVADLFDRTITALQNDLPLDPTIDYQTIHALNGFSAIAKKPGSRLKIGGVVLGERYASTVKSLLEPDTNSLGSVTGRLEGLTIHGASKFILYPLVAGEEVDCIFKSGDLQSVLKAVAKNVTVYGTLHYAKTKSFPVSVDVDSFEAVEDERLPTLLNACGILRNQSSSVDIVRELRDEWK